MHKFYKKLVILTALVFFSPSIIAIAKPHNEYQTTYALLLSKYVITGEKKGIKATLVNYSSWAKDKQHLKTIRILQQTNPNKLTGKEKIAFWLNAYNLLTIDLIIKTGERETIRNQGGFFRNVWQSHRWKIYGEYYTLDQIEHKILRKMGEPRIHFAINCASLSCPDLLNRPYQAEKLESQLQTQTRNFLYNSTKGIQITLSGIKLSKIFDWFEEDFGGKENSIKFINSYVPASKNKTAIQGYLNYDWNLNCQTCNPS